MSEHCSACNATRFRAAGASAMLINNMLMHLIAVICLV
jgi:hypothetical protein